MYARIAQSTHEPKGVSTAVPWPMIPERVMFKVGRLLFVTLVFAGVAVAEDAPADSDPVAGEWTLITTRNSRDSIESRIVIKRRADGALTGVYHHSNNRGTSVLLGVTLKDGVLRFGRISGGNMVTFQGKVDADRISGAHTVEGREFPVVAARGEKAVEALREQHRKTQAIGDDHGADYERHARRVGRRDEFPVLFDPRQTPALDAKGVHDDEYVIGIEIGGEAKAYPIAVMGQTEVANDTCGGIPIATSW